jgi:hypothetical protein
MYWEKGSRLALAIGAVLLLVCAAPVPGQEGAPAAAGPSVAFSPVTGFPVPLQSVSGRFSSLNPLNEVDCPDQDVSGRVVSPSLILVKQLSCGEPVHDNLLVNVKLSNPADAAQMVMGRHVVITGRLKSAGEDSDPVDFLIAENARLVAGDPIDPSAPPAQAFTSYMMCQPPELDALARQLGSELCVQSTLVANLTETGPALESAARVPEKVSPQDTVRGDPNAITCRVDHGISDRHLSDIACARNSYWAWYKAEWREPMSPIAAPP